MLSGDTHDCWLQIKTRILDLERKYVPVRQIRHVRKPNAIWMTHGAVNLVTKKRKIFAKYKDSHHPAVVKADKVATRAVKKANKQFETKKL